MPAMWLALRSCSVWRREPAKQLAGYLRYQGLSPSSGRKRSTQGRLSASGYPASHLFGRWAMEVIFTHCAGLDVHKKRITACRAIPDPTGQQTDGLMERKDFGTLTSELLAFGLAERRGDHPCGDGEHRGVLEARVQPVGRALLGAPGQCGPREAGPRAQDRQGRCAMAGCRPASFRRSPRGICGI
jgi:hypothetical protein